MAALAMVAAAACAQDRNPATLFIQSGGGEEGIYQLTVGGTTRPFWRSATGLATAHVEGYASYWNGREIGGGRKGFGQLAAVPMLRLRFAEGRSPFFIEGGIGVSYMTPHYLTRNKRFGSKFNFSDNLAVGWNVTPSDELSLRVQHISNGGYKQPNPGENFVLIRYARGF